jgi:hypothetical protein
VIAGGLQQRIAHVAEQHLRLSTAELERRLELAWIEATGGGRIPTRDDARAFWREARDQLVAQILANRDVVAITTGMITDDVLTWAQQVGIPFEKYDYVLALFVALVTQAVLKAVSRRAGSKNDRNRKR